MPTSAWKKLEAAMQLQRGGDLDGAEKGYRRVLARDTRDVRAAHLLSALLLERGRDAEAADILRRAVHFAPEQAILLANLGEAERRVGDRDVAIGYLVRATRLAPGLAEAHYTLGLTLQDAGRFEESVARFSTALSLRPEMALAHAMMAKSLRRLERFEEAIASWNRALQADPSNAGALSERGLDLLELGRNDEALASFRRACELRPDDPVLHSRVVYTLGLQPDQDARSILAEASRWRDLHASTFADLRSTPDSDRNPDRRLRVGYLSPDFRNHSHALFLTPTLQHHDRNEVEVVALSLTEVEDEFTVRIREVSDQFLDLSRVSERDLFGAIRRAHVDVLVDVAMHGAGNRLRTLAARPAPVQLTWLAYPGTTGLDAIDYRITDPHLDPPGAGVDSLYAERSLRLPETFWCYDPLVSEPEVNELPALREGFVTFGCLNNVNRRNDAVFRLWARVLQAVEGSRMVVLAHPGEPSARLRDAFEREGVDPSRLLLRGRSVRHEYFLAYHGIDISLDTVPCSGGTTSLDSFWMGVPVVTLIGHTVAGRAGLSFAANLELPELASHTTDGFVEAAVRLAADLSRLAELRGGLRERLRRSPLMDGPRFARNLESIYRTAWRAWCAQPA